MIPQKLHQSDVTQVYKPVCSEMYVDSWSGCSTVSDLKTLSVKACLLIAGNAESSKETLTDVV